jgi:DNA invertase Pin-like site-specific DNA recombinase
LERQREGIAKAKAEGNTKADQLRSTLNEVKRVASLVGAAAAAKQLGIARSTVYRLLDHTSTGTTH